jgi:hypothetical protein
VAAFFLPQRTGEAEGFAGPLLFDFSFFEPQGQGDTGLHGEPFAFALLPLCLVAFVFLLRLGSSKKLTIRTGKEM